MGNFIAGAIKKPGSLRNAAKKAGESTSQFAAENKNAPGKLGKRSRLAETLMKLGKK